MGTKVTEVSHDAFGRFSIMRQSVGKRAIECVECGRPARWYYGTAQDDSPHRHSWNTHAFCSIGCYRSYRSHSE